ncbi:MAG: class I SAM-dependent methyltransferase [Methylococcaceae bacterium]
MITDFLQSDFFRRFKKQVRLKIKPHDKISFLHSLPPYAQILDVGCGNNSPYITKTIQPSCIYTGIDIGDYNQSKVNLADYYLVTDADGFAAKIAEFKACFDVVISSHNLEHCNHREQTLNAMLGAVKPGGLFYLSFPCEQSVTFPKRLGTLNYYDDATHKDLPPDFEGILKSIQAQGFEVQRAIKNYKPVVFWLLGLLLETKSRRNNQVYVSTWAFYGFESIITAKKIT